jgi:transcriptional regulator with XRE-family HTH domain
MKNIGFEIDKILTERRSKKKDFAEKLNMSVVNLSKIVHKSSIDAELLEKIARTLGVPVSYFFDESGAEVGSGEMGNIKIKQEHNGNGHNILNGNAELKHRIEMLERDNESLKKENAELKKDKEFLQSLLKKP